MVKQSMISVKVIEAQAIKLFGQARFEELMSYPEAMISELAEAAYDRDDDDAADALHLITKLSRYAALNVTEIKGGFWRAA